MGLPSPVTPAEEFLAAIHGLLERICSAVEGGGQDTAEPASKPAAEKPAAKPPAKRTRQRGSR